MSKRIINSLFIIMGLFLLGGCTQSSIQLSKNSAKFAKHRLDVYKNFSHPEVGDNEKVYKASEAISNWKPIEQSRIKVLKKAKNFCAEKGGKMILLQEHIANLPYLINHFPRVEISFVCHKKAKNQKTVVNKNTQSISIIKEKYKNLEFLKKLLDDGALTKEEFNREKQKLLNEK